MLTFLCVPLSLAAGPSLLNIFMDLRKVCNHPYLMMGAENFVIESMRKVTLSLL